MDLTVGGISASIPLLTIHSELLSSSWLAWLDTNVVDKVDLFFFSIFRRNEGTGRTMLCSGKEVGAPLGSC